MSPRGRRPGGEDTRAAILDAARGEFAQRGYEGTSLRAVAREAGVDPRLVHHYFGGKAELFTEVLAFPVDPAVIVEEALAAPRDRMGETLARVFLGVWDGEEGRQRFTALFASVAAHEDHARMIREFVGREIFGRLVERLRADSPSEAPPDLELRAALGAAQLIGVGMLRYVVGIPALAQADVEDIAAAVGPVVQGYLVGEGNGDDEHARD